MTWLVLGLVLFLGPHSVRIVADGWRSAMIERMGLGAWKGAYALVSLAGLALVAYGYGQARASAGLVWMPPAWGRHATGLFVLIAFVLVAAAYIPGTKMREVLGHPMLAGVKAWAFGHLLANGSSADVVLFGAFLAWAIIDFAVARRRDRAQGIRHPSAGWSRDALAVVAGVVGSFVFARWLHVPLIGVAAF